MLKPQDSYKASQGSSSTAQRTAHGAVHPPVQTLLGQWVPVAGSTVAPTLCPIPTCRAGHNPSSAAAPAPEHLGNKWSPILCFIYTTKCARSFWVKICTGGAFQLYFTGSAGDQVVMGGIWSCAISFLHELSHPGESLTSKPF